jgi:superfamily I DNA/RNA helicase
LNPRVTIFTGQAGTGKTTRLIERLRSTISETKFQDYQSVLAITFMHGSRRRLNSKLHFLKSEFKLKYVCTTIDSFLVSLLNRFRSYLHIQRVISVNIDNDETIETNEFEILLPLPDIQEKVIQLLQIQTVKDYLNNSYPVIVIDEFQDCQGNLLRIIENLALTTNLLIATDPFQQLNNEVDNSGQKWIEENDFEVENLDGRIWRTNNNRILNTAKALRIGEKVEGEKIYITLATGSKGVASSFLKKNIYFGLRSKYEPISIIAPSISIRFVKNAIADLNRPIIYKGKTIGPYHNLISIPTLNKGITPPEHIYSDLTKNGLMKLKNSETFVIRSSASTALRKLLIRNKSELSRIEFENIVKQTVHKFDNYIAEEKFKKIILTTIHGAKNREFDSVIVLWPYEVAGDILYKRKLLYNAITRAKKSAIVIVQHDNMDIDELKKNELFKFLID